MTGYYIPLGQLKLKTLNIPSVAITSGVCVKWHNYFRNNLAFFLKKKVYLLYFCAVLHLCCCTGLFLVAEWGLLGCGAWASPGVGLVVQRTGFRMLSSCELSCSTGNEIFPEKGSNSCPRHCLSGFLIIVPAGKF